ncbi:MULTISPECIES: hypothetical protein [Klebsiella pneumoniae complex]|uniref:hypothetical protein n=1 Tax=Klebsiella pneumoniae complex TaxID=3390273 RepID=UPI000E2C8B6C|nr:MULTISPECIES: hypothetical protein [Klebsiella]EIW8628537.1 hypothetical protein [Klebsiella pneumoniae]EKJ7344720.1 hypothetical protein [Klebsiella pneumoniae]EKX8521844.1 hypothetical protein [Klebsiella pneumoniae]EMB4841553.1 hypothetical protein [Klebsiella pneumoniae]MBA7805699.1 hypothetical protein [Klebsiella pneumoniae]
MSFTVSKKVSRQLSYSEFGASDASEVITADLAFEAVNVIGLDAKNICQVQFSVVINGSSNPGSYIHSFTFSGNGNPLNEAEASLREEIAL